MKVCIVTSSFPAGPADVSLAACLPGVIQALKSRGHSVVVYTQETPVAVENWPGIRVERFHWASFQGRISDLTVHPVRNLRLLFQFMASGTLGFRRLQAREKFDSVLCCWVVPAGLLVRLSAVFGKSPPYIVWALGSDIQNFKGRALGRLVLRWVLNGAARRYADGFKLAEDTARISGRDCEFLPTIRLLEAKSQERTPDPTRFLFVGRHETLKGLDRLVEALLQLAAENPGLPFSADIVGSGTLSRALRSRVAEAGQTARIRFPGSVDSATLADFYQAAGCVVIPSLSESIPLVLGEAIQFRRPVIVTEVGDMGYLVNKYRLGRVIAPADTEALKAALEDFLVRGFGRSAALWGEALRVLSPEESLPRLAESLERLGT